MSGQRDQTIDFFRGTAILLVVLFHFTARLPDYALNITEGAPLPLFFGWVGVYFFFIISGYCIFMTLERSETVGIYLARRFSRIYPAFAAAVLALFVFGMVFYVPSVPEANFHEVAPGPFDVILNLLFIGEIGEWVDGAFWSIAVEVKFYVLVAILAGFIHDKRRFTLFFAWLALIMAPIWAFSTLISGAGAITPQSMLKFLAIAPYLSFFAVGILGRQYESGTAGAGRLLAANVAVSTVVVWIEAYSFELHDGWITASVCALVYLGLALLFVRFVRGWSVPSIAGVTWSVSHIGLLSFSWYLIHENIGMSMLATLNLYLPAGVTLVLVLVSTFLIALVFASLFEWRFRKPVERLAVAGLDWVGRSIRPLSGLRVAPMARPAE
ncbi:MAG: acyltransferase [Devosia sp.]|uniref:acyltransferase family protein n=1 Tax=Devosia sp. TaxID=1871048 RepID=UPI0024CCC25D|nr:acyltransferase [Devosia sp.]UYN99848.1 MAG: acyltransferase [Devosia sp.]